MIDLHCHILPRLDDGAVDLNDAVGMGRQAEADGIQAICATPHIRHDHDVRIRELPDRLRELAQALGGARCPVELLPGGEVSMTSLAGLDDDELRGVTLGGSGRWILLEPQPGPLDDAVEEAVRRLGARGFRALVAHPERHLAPDLTRRLSRLVAQGALVQATAAFFVTEATRPGMLELARQGLVHVLGSDSHSSRTGRPVALKGAFAVLNGVEGLAAHLTWMAETAPRAIVAGEEITPPFWPPDPPAGP